ncbi:MAG: hypothetical protein ACYC3L_03930 [Gemmatimonadaceae bacterium]
MSDPAASLDRRLLAATIAVALLLGLFAMNDVALGIFQDDGHYLILARALAQGDGYRYTNLPGAPAGTHFPPGFPLLLAPVWWLAPRFPANVAVFKLVNVALMPVAAIGIRAFARRVGGLSSPAASLLAIACIATVPLLFLNGLLFSETAFIAALCGTLVLAESVAAGPGGGAVPVRRVLLAGLAIGALGLLRTVGLALLPALLVVLALDGRWRHAMLAAAAAMVPLVPWQVWTALHAHDVPLGVVGGYGAYSTWLADAYRTGGVPFAVAVLRENLDGLRMPLTLFGLIDAPGWVQLLAAVPLVGFLGAGLRVLWRRARVSVLVLPPYLALLLVWPFPPDRFLWPLWPLLVLAMVLGARALGWRDVASRRWRWTARAAAAALVALFVVWHARTWPTRNWEGGERANARMGAAAARVAAALPRDGLVASDMDAMVHLYAARPAVPLLALTAEQHVRERTDDEVAAQLAGVLDAYHPRWVLVTERESLRAARVLMRRGRLRLAGADPSGVLVYDVSR